VIEGALIAAAATRANHVVLYVNPHQPLSLAATCQAVQQWQQHALFVALEQRVGGPVTLRVLPSSGLYIGGEETAVIASVEGGFPFPRRKPPFPAEAGVHGVPTIVNNTETLAHVPGILRHGAQWYRDLGIGNAAGTKLYSLSGDVLHPGLYELPMGTSLASLVFQHGGGMLQGKEFKAVFTGGPSNTLLTKRDLDVALDFDSVRQRHSRLGTGAMIVVSEGSSIVRKVAEYVSFFAQGSCGQCPPCKGGTFQLMRLLNRLDTGRAVRADLEALENLCRILPGSGRCGLIDGAVTVVESSVNQFREEYEALLMA
jgi:NADH-quinone oxidoreductase subunit F